MQDSKARVLVVDDEPQMRVALEDVLTDDYSVLTSHSGAHALDLMAQDHEIAVLLTDHRMPHMNGDEFLSRLGDSVDTTRILITGFADLDAVIRAVNEGGIFAYVTKPWNADDLRLKVRRGVELFRLTREVMSERRALQDLMNSVPDGIYFKDEKLRFLRVNQAFQRALGVNAADELIGRRLSEVLPGPESTALEDAENRVLSERIPAEDALRADDRGETRRWFSDSRAPIRNATGQVIGLAGISRDVSGRVKTEEALRTSERRFREQSRVLNSVLSGMGEGTVVSDRDGQFLLFNRRAEQILGIGPRRVSAQTLAEVYGIYTQDQQALVSVAQNPLIRATTHDERIETEIFIRNEAVAGANVSVTATPLKEEDGTLIGSIALLRDVTHQRQLEQQLLQSRKMEAIGKLAGSVAHDFNNLLSVILSYSGILLSEVGPLDPIRSDLEAIRKASERAADLTRQLLAFSRRQLLAPRVIDLNKVVAESEKMLRRLLGDDVALTSRYAPGLPFVKVDPGQIEQVVMNLAVNARDAMPRGGRLTIETRHVVVDPEADQNPEIVAGRYVLLTVTDTGCGMDAATLGQMFEPFFTTKAPGKGTGLGLSTVFGIVKQSGGHVSASSVLGQGTSFKVYLPCTDESLSVVEEIEVPATLNGSETILLVEDQGDVRRAAQHILERHGYEVIEARNAGEALLSCERHPGTIHLLLTDVVMPQMDGHELAERLRLVRPDLCVLYMSGYTENAILERGILGHGKHLIQKPFTPEMLARRVREALDLAIRRASLRPA